MNFLTIMWWLFWGFFWGVVILLWLYVSGCTSSGWEYGMIREANEAGCNMEGFKVSRERQTFELACK